MQLKDYVAILRRRWLLIVILVVACTAGAGYASERQTPTYSTTAQLIVNGSSSLSASDELATRQLADERAVAFAQIASTGPALQAALQLAQQVAGPFSATGGPSASASASGKDPFLYVRVTDTDPRRAEAVANAYVKILPGTIQKLEQGTTATPEEIAVVSPAGLPSATKHLKRNLAVGIAIGIVLGIAVALLLEALDRRLRDASQVEDAAGLPILATVPYELSKEGVPTISSPMSVRAEAYRKVRANLAFITDSGAPRSVAVTSATSSEGKTSLATNLAFACAKSGQRVLLVDADLRRPMVHQYLSMSPDRGLVEVLGGTATVEDVIQHSPDGTVDVIVAGTIPANPSELLGSSAMIQLMARWQADYDIVIVDTPPVLPVADTLVLGVLVEGVVLVCRLGETTSDKVRQAKESLEKVHAKVLGVVPNGSKATERYYRYSYKRSREEPKFVPLATEAAVTPSESKAVGADQSGRPTGAHFGSTGAIEHDAATAPASAAGVQDRPAPGAATPVEAPVGTNAPSGSPAASPFGAPRPEGQGWNPTESVWPGTGSSGDLPPGRSDLF